MRPFAVLLAALAPFAWLGQLVLSGRLPPAAPVVLVLISLVTFLHYARDKRAARLGSARVAERTLLLHALFGGWPGALIASRLLHHKTRKQPFRRWFWVTVVVNLAVLAALGTAAGGDWAWRADAAVRGIAWSGSG